MYSKNLITIFALAITFSISSTYAVKAGGPPPTTSGGASLRGVVKFESTVPKTKPISNSPGPSCARQHPSPGFSQEVMNGSKGDLEKVGVYIAEGLGDRTVDVCSQTVR